jgi:2-polyprenyl-3-methyl-5-hydroxy-6-metoxy-1,4-benzoquinol methylase
MMQRDCPVCGRVHVAAEEFGPFVTTHWKTFSREHFSLVECANCGLIYLSPPPTAADINIMYVESEQFTDATYTSTDRIASVMEYMSHGFRSTLSLSAFTPDANLNVLEIGAGLAWMCRAAKEVNAGTVTVAQDLTSEVASQCTWVDHYVVGDLSNSRIDENAPYHLASMTHVIEHLIDPIDTLRRIASVLAPGGGLFITAPHRPKGWDEEKKASLWENYSYHHVPAHTQYFSEFSMRYACEAAGLNLLRWDQGHEAGEAFEAIAGKPT